MFSIRPLPKERNPKGRRSESRRGAVCRRAAADAESLLSGILPLSRRRWWVFACTGTPRQPIWARSPAPATNWLTMRRFSSKGALSFWPRRGSQRGRRSRLRGREAHVPSRGSGESCGPSRLGRSLDVHEYRPASTPSQRPRNTGRSQDLATCHEPARRSIRAPRPAASTYAERSVISSPRRRIRCTPRSMAGRKPSLPRKRSCPAS